MRDIWNVVAAIAMGAVIWSLGVIDLMGQWWIPAVLVAVVLGAMIAAQMSGPDDVKPSSRRVLTLVVLIAVTFMLVPRWDWQGLQMIPLALLSIGAAGNTWWALHVHPEQPQAPRTSQSQHT